VGEPLEYKTNAPLLAHSGSSYSIVAVPVLWFAAILKTIDVDCLGDYGYSKN
jgi:hypothetical protein